MPIIDGPDFGSPNYDDASPVSYDSSQISDRSQGFSLADNLGRMLIFDDFRNGVAGWNNSNSGGGLSPAVIFPVSFNGLAFHAPCVLTMDPVLVGGISQLTRSWFDLDLNKLGVEVVFLNRASLADINVRLIRNFNLTTYQTDITYSAQNDIFTSTDVVGQFTIETLPHLIPGQFVWTSMKIVMDPNNNKLVRANIGGRSYDLGTRQLPTSVPLVTPDFTFTVQINANGGPTAFFFQPVNIGYVLVTRNEP